MMHGKGVYSWPKWTYEGDYVKDKKHGKGKLTWPDGSSYEGDFVEDAFEGDGVKV